MSRSRAFCMLLLCAGLAAQTPDTCTLQGEVLDATHAGVPGVQVTARNTFTGFERSTETGPAGDFSLSGLPAAGRYQITASKPEFIPHLSEVTLAGGTTAYLTLELGLRGGHTRLTVTGVAGEVRADAPQLGERLSAFQIQQMPLPNRRISYLPLLNAANHPAINQGDAFMNQNLFTTNGSGRRQAWFEIDGANGTDLWGRQTIFTNIPAAAVEEMAVLENAFSAEYGASAGAVINIVTRSGGDQLHGELLQMFRPSATAAALSGFSDANAASGTDLTSDRLAQSAFSLSGPIGRTHFAASVEYSREDRASPVTSPVAPGSFLGRYRGWLGFLRLDRQLGEKHNLFFRSSTDAFHDTNPNGTVGGNNLPSVGRVFRRRTYSEELGETAVLSPALLNSARVQFQLASPITQFDPLVYGTQYAVPISAGGTFTSGTSQAALLQNRQYEATDTVSGIWGRHQLKAGANVIAAHSGGNGKEFGGPIYLGRFEYNTCTAGLSFCESAAYLGDIANVRSYTQSYGNARYRVGDVLWALFLQDDYRLRPSLTINLGLRYERQTFTDAARNFAPRVGFAYNWRGDAKTVIRGGFGIYYSQIPDNAAANYALGGPTGVFNYTAGPGQIGFPSSIAAAPLPAFPNGAVAPVRSLYIRPGRSGDLDRFFPTATLIGYPGKLLNPYAEQWTFGIQRRLGPSWVLSADYIGSHTLKINRPLDVDPPAPFVRTRAGQVRSAQAANCTRPYWTWWYKQQGAACNPAAAASPQPPYAAIQSDVNNGFGFYDALDVNLSRSFGGRLSMLASYTWSHAIDNVDPDVPGQNPNDPNFTGGIEKGNAIFDQRHRFVLSGVYIAPLGINIGGIATLASGLPYNLVTGLTNSGDNGATADRPVSGGGVVGRNAGRGRPVYEVSPFLERSFPVRADRVRLVMRAEAFNALNHANFAGYSGTWGNGAAPGPGLGQPLAGVTNQLPPRAFQFSGKLTW